MRAAAPVIAAALVAAALVAASLIAPAAAEARARAVADSGETVRSVSISPRGIIVERSNGTDSSAAADDWTSDRIGRRIHNRIRNRIHSRIVEFDEAGTGVVRILSDATVPAGKRVDGDVVAVCGSVDVTGEVTGDVVAVLGSVHVRPGARIHGDAVSIGGGLDQAQGAVIDGESVSLGFSPFTWGLPALPVMMFAIAIGWVVSVFAGWIFALLFPTGMLRVATVVERRPAASFFLGVLSVPMFFVALALLLVTVIGIPLAILLPMFYVLIGYAGQLAATAVLGARLMRRSLADGMVGPLAIGTLFVALLLGAGAVFAVSSGFGHPAALFFTLSGALLLLGLGSLGTGAFLLSRFGTRPRDVAWHGRAAVAGAIPGAAAPPATS
ncbi:MAG: hypothetical protein HYR74_02110 [Candidatus Eisenbacteria bacterium]|nr:hypothetical protein [Candidatus Eisenbacteria bacterium]